MPGLRRDSPGKEQGSGREWGWEREGGQRAREVEREEGKEGGVGVRVGVGEARGERGLGRSGDETRERRRDGMRKTTTAKDLRGKGKKRERGGGLLGRREGEGASEANRQRGWKEIQE